MWGTQHGFYLQTRPKLVIKAENTFPKLPNFAASYRNRFMEQLQQDIQKALKSLFDLEENVVLQPTRKEFEGSYTYVVFPLVKLLKKSPADLGNADEGASSADPDRMIYPDIRIKANVDLGRFLFQIEI